MIFVATDLRILYDGKDYFAPSQGYDIFKRYYENFGKFKLCARKVETMDNPQSYINCTEMVNVFIGFSTFFDLNKKDFKQKVVKALENINLIIGRLPSFSGNVLYNVAKKYNKPFYSEVMADAWDAFWNHSLKGKVIAPYMYLKTKSVVKNSDYALYVTNKFLQEKYPCKKESVGVSNVKIAESDEEILKLRLEKIKKSNFNEITITTTAAVNVWFKGQQYVMQAIPILNRLGIKVKYRLIGGGDKSRLLNLAKKLSVESQVEFVGRKTLNEVFALLDDTDIYIQPSLQEGLPRSVIEAMSRACPSLGAKTAGIPELINKKCVFKRKSPKAIAQSIYNILNIEELSSLAIENFNEAKNYTEDVLNEKRNAYYNKVKKELGII